jgi:hypothetical protein
MASPQTSSIQPSSIDSKAYYNNYHGHLIPHLNIVHAALRPNPVMWLAGDSSLDNKYWFYQHSSAAIGGYEQILDPPLMKQDIAYHLTSQSLSRQLSPPAPTGHAAIEATTLNQRVFGLLAQDKFIRDNIQSDDTLVVSVGGNDIALLPSCCTICNMLGLVYCTPTSFIEHGCSNPLPVDDCCCGCGASSLSMLTSFPPCGGYFAHLFRVRVQSYAAHSKTCFCAAPNTSLRSLAGTSPSSLPRRSRSASLCA